MAKAKVKVIVFWENGEPSEYVVDQVGTIAQRYRQLNFVTDEGIGVAINLHLVKSVEITSSEEEHILRRKVIVDFNDIAHT